MRIGAYLGDVNPESGGGYTFQEEVLKALLNQASIAPQHDFYIVGTSLALNKFLTKSQTPLNVKFLTVKQPNLFERCIDWLKKGFLPLGRILKLYGPLEELCRKNKIDLMWFVSGGSFELIDTPYIATVWDLQHKLQPWFPEVSANGAWAGRELHYQYFLRRASYIIVGTEVGREEVEMFYQVPAFRIYKLPHPTPSFLIDSESVGLKNIDKYLLPKHYIFYPAQLWSHKNHINLLHAMRIINDKYQVKLPLVLVGSDKGNGEHIKDVAKDIGVFEQLYMLGFVPQEDLYTLYQKASMLAYVSLCGPENLPPLEAFVVGCPVVASEVSGSREQFGNAVLYCDPKNPQDIAQKIYQLHSDNELKDQLTTNGHIRAASWTSDDFVKGVFEIADEFNAIKRNWIN